MTPFCPHCQRPAQGETTPRGYHDADNGGCGSPVVMVYETAAPVPAGWWGRNWLTVCLWGLGLVGVAVVGHNAGAW